jgi:hypothetical protein
VEFQFVAKRRPRDYSVHAQLASVYRTLGQDEPAKAEMETHRRLLQERSGASRNPSPSNAP